ncbi:MAG: hypothetical protein L6Q99_06215 [Planctomycetes bacterium]|nr:hypothetical protein [Planctomycetota bacterium]
MPVATVKSRLQRALERLRVGLDQRFGDRTNWGVALLPLAEPGRALGPWFTRWLDLKLVHVLALGAFGAGVWAAARALPSFDESMPAAASVARAGEPVVVLGANGAPEIGARVRWVATDRPNALEVRFGVSPKHGEAVTDSSGVFHLPNHGAHLVEITPSVGLAQVVSGEFGRSASVRLAPSGALEVTCLDRSGAPLPGVELALVQMGPALGGEFVADAARSTVVGAPATPLRPRLERALAGEASALEALDLGDELERAQLASSFARVVLEANPESRVPRTLTSDAQGRAVWSLLPASGGYAVRVLSDHVFADLVADEGARRIGADVQRELGPGTVPRPFDVSPTLTVTAGPTTAVRLIVSRPASVVGRVRAAGLPWSEPPRLEILHAASPGSAFVAGSGLASAVAADGAFRVERWRPGRTQLRAEWRDAGGATVVASVDTTLAEGPNDVGELAPLDGPPLLVELDFVDRAGRSLDPTDCLVTSEESGFRAVLARRSAGAGSRGEIQSLDLLLVPGRPTVVRGLAPGTWSLHAFGTGEYAWKPGRRAIEVRDGAECELVAGARLPMTLVVD